MIQVVTVGDGSPNARTSNAAGVYTNTDTRVDRNGNTLQRETPFAWYDALYATGNPGGKTLADPGVGYPITGTTQFYGYTCYTPRNREHVVNFLGWDYDGVTQDSTGTNRSGVFTNSSTGLLARSNIGAMPAAWKNAAVQTFLTNSNQTALGQRLGDLNLWIQNQPTPGGSANPTCSGKTGM